MKRKTLYFIVGGLALLLAGLHFFLPLYAAREIREEINTELDQAEKIEVRVEATPGWKILMSRADNVYIKGEKWNYSGLELNKINSSYSDLLIKDGIVYGENHSLQIGITEKDLNQYLEDEEPAFQKLDLRIKEEELLLEGKVRLFGTELNLKLSGYFEVLERNRITFAPASFELENFELPSSILKNFIDDLNLILDLNFLPFPVNIENVDLEEGLLIIRGGEAVSSINKGGVNGDS